VRIPAKSPGFDKEWQAHGHLDRAVELAADWARARPVEGLQVEVVRLPGRTPVLLMEVRGTSDETVLLYGHLDKQPEMIGWGEGLGPWTPVRRGGRLYGRGAADDGYAAFAALTAVESLQAQGVPHARCIVLVETCEESGSADQPAYMDALKARIGTPGLIICLDASAGNYEQLWRPRRSEAWSVASCRWRSWAWAFTREPAESCRRASGSCASYSRVSRTSGPVRSFCASSTSRSRPSAPGARGGGDAR
jgi:hypothetical protein